MRLDQLHIIISLALFLFLALPGLLGDLRVHGFAELRFECLIYLHEVQRRRRRSRGSSVGFLSNLASARGCDKRQFEKGFFVPTMCMHLFIIKKIISVPITAATEYMELVTHTSPLIPRLKVPIRVLQYDV